MFNTDWALSWVKDNKKQVEQTYLENDLEGELTKKGNFLVLKTIHGYFIPCAEVDMGSIHWIDYFNLSEEQVNKFNILD